VSAVTVQVIALLLLLNAFYVAAEFAFVAVRKGQVQVLAEEGNTFARRVLDLIGTPTGLDRAIAICQTGITLCSLLLGAYGEAKLTPFLAPRLVGLADLTPEGASSLAAGLVLFVLTSFQVVFGELVPKLVALQYPVKTALYTVLPLRWSGVLFSWFMVILNGSGNALLRLMGVAPGNVRHVHSPQEIEILLAESRREGLIEPEEHVRLKRALRLNMRSARQLMVDVEDVVAVNADAPLEDALNLAARSPYTRLPVYQGSRDRFIGLLHVKDLVRYQLEHGNVPSLRVVMRPVVRVSERMEADEVLAQLREKKTHLAIVTGEDKRSVGLITLEDVLAEVMGDIGDEFKGSTEVVPEEIDGGRVRIPGNYPLENAESWVGVSWKGEAKTVGGFIMQKLGGRPAPGQRVNIEGVEVEIERVARQRITSVIATPPSKEAASDG
jgi:putative hemolysin